MAAAIGQAQDLQSLHSAKLVEQTVTALREQIVAGNYASGEVLPSQGELCIELGVSRSVIREAMRTLQSQGLVEVSQGRRPTVLPAGPEAVIETLSTLVERSPVSLLQLLEVRRPLEIEIAALAAGRRSGEDLKQLREAVHKLRDAPDIESQIDADIQFHKVLAEAGGNPLFGIVLAVLAGLLRESRRKTIKQSGIETALSFHQQILDAVETKDIDRARESMAEHLKQTKFDINSTNK